MRKVGPCYFVRTRGELPLQIFQSDAHKEPSPPPPTPPVFLAQIIVTLSYSLSLCLSLGQCGDRRVQLGKEIPGSHQVGKHTC